MASGCGEIGSTGMTGVCDKFDPRSQAPLGNASREAPLRVNRACLARQADAKQSFATVRSQAELGNEKGGLCPLSNLIIRNEVLRPRPADPERRLFQRN